MLSNRKEQLITLPVRDLIWCVLGDDKSGLECAQITTCVAEVLSPHLKESLSWIIIFEDEEGHPYNNPILWRYRDWHTSYTRYTRQKAYSDKQRAERFVLEANVNNMIRVLMKQHSLSENFARPLAYKMIKSGSEEVAKALGLKKVITKVEEI